MASLGEPGRHTLGATMDPVSAEALAALAGGAGGEMGRQALTTLANLLRRTRRTSVQRTDATGSGEEELHCLSQTPDDQDAARALSGILAERSVADPAFRAALEDWQRQNHHLTAEHNTVHNTVSGGTFHGPVLQAGDLSGITITSQSTPAAQPPCPPDTPTTPTATGSDAGRPRAD